MSETLTVIVLYLCSGIREIVWLVPCQPYIPHCAVNVLFKSVPLHELLWPALRVKFRYCVIALTMCYSCFRCAAARTAASRAQPRTSRRITRPAVRGSRHPSSAHTIAPSRSRTRSVKTVTRWPCDTCGERRHANWGGALCTMNVPNFLCLRSLARSCREMADGTVSVSNKQTYCRGRKHFLSAMVCWISLQKDGIPHRQKSSSRYF